MEHGYGRHQYVRKKSLMGVDIMKTNLSFSPFSVAI